MRNHDISLSEGMLARLQPKEEVLLLGWGVPIPVRSRKYDEEFWKELLGGGGKKNEAQNLKELGVLRHCDIILLVRKVDYGYISHHPHVIEGTGRHP